MINVGTNDEISIKNLSKFNVLDIFIKLIVSDNEFKPVPIINSFLFESPIIPILIKDPMETIVLRDRLLEKGILVGAVRPPTVPGNTSRLRISLHTGVKETLVDELIPLLDKWKKN